MNASNPAFSLAPKVTHASSKSDSKPKTTTLQHPEASSANSGKYKNVYIQQCNYNTNLRKRICL